MGSSSDGRIDRRRFEIPDLKSETGPKSEAGPKSKFRPLKPTGRGGKRKSTVVISVVVLAVVGLVTLAFVYRGEIQQEWYLSRMESEAGEGRRGDGAEASHSRAHVAMRRRPNFSGRQGLSLPGPLIVPLPASRLRG